MPTKPRNWVNHEIVTLAVFQIGGDVKHVDTEDVAKRANELAPGRFAWRKYPDQINIENVRTFLKDATRTQNGAYLNGSGKKGWMLTAEGLAFARRAETELSNASVSRARPTQEEQDLARWKARESGRLVTTAAYKKWVSGEKNAISKQDADDFFRIDDYVVLDDRQRRIQRVQNLATKMGDLPLIQLSEYLESMEKETRT